jgi:hypothetical protein
MCLEQNLEKDRSCHIPAIHMTIPSSFHVGQGFAFFVDNQYQFFSGLVNRLKLALRSKDLVELAFAFIVVLTVLAVISSPS